ncbi:hypothetical protein ACJRO7_023803, partial [Eucalyptus globulus]
IWVGWDPTVVSFEVLSVSDQMILGKLCWLETGVACYVSVIYAEHSFSTRRPLWEDLVARSYSLQDVPSLVLGDFNAIKDPSDRLGGSDLWLPCFDEFRQCLDQAELDDLRYVGFRYTWSTSSGPSRKMRKIDRVLVNPCWSQVFSFSEASFLALGISDHSPMVVKVENPILRKRPFKFFDFWMQHPDFDSIVKQGRLKQLNRDSFANISVRNSEAREALKQTQVGLLNDPTSMVLADLERAQRRTLVELRSQEESFFRQKARIRWFKEGDRNTKFFHQYVSKRHLRNRILSVVDSSGNQITEPQL